MVTCLKHQQMYPQNGFCPYCGPATVTITTPTVLPIYYPYNDPRVVDPTWGTNTITGEPFNGNVIYSNGTVYYS